MKVGKFMGRTYGDLLNDEKYVNWLKGMPLYRRLCAFDMPNRELWEEVGRDLLMILNSNNG